MVKLRDILEVLGHPPSLHAATVHAPIILAMIGAVLCALVAATRGRNATLRVGACVCLAMVVASALAAASAGERAFALMGDASVAARETAATHRWMAEKVWVLAVVALGASALAWARRPSLAMFGRLAAAGVSGLLAAWVGLTAHHGGTLVYRHGVGVPSERAARAGDSRGAAPEDVSADPRVVFFESGVRPLLTRNCMGCHGPEGFAASGLSLSSPAGYLKGGRRGAAVVPGNPEASLLLKAVRGDSLPRMPYNQAALEPAEIAALERWVREGAVWR